MDDPIRNAAERLVAFLDECAADGVSMIPEHAADLRTALAAELVDGLSPKETEAQEAFTQMRDEVLGGVWGLDSDQINSILHIIDNYTPEWV